MPRTTKDQRSNAARKAQRTRGKAGRSKAARKAHATRRANARTAIIKAATGPQISARKAGSLATRLGYPAS